jgi:hypothetical protein
LIFRRLENGDSHPVLFEFRKPRFDPVVDVDRD